MTNFTAASISPAFPILAAEFDVSFTKVSYLITFQILFLGIGNLVWVPTARKIGKRPTFILSNAIFLAACLWCVRATSWNSMFASRLFQGFGASVAEGIGPAAIADVFFLHERGTKIGFYMYISPVQD